MLEMPRSHAVRHALSVVVLSMTTGLAAAAPIGDGPEQSNLFFLDPSLLASLPSLSLPSGEATAQFAGRVRDRASTMVQNAMTFLGVPYKRGGSSETLGFDCSGFTRRIFSMSLGIDLPRRADEQAKAPGLVPVSEDKLKPGELVFFNTLKRTFSHVGIYIGEGKFIHAPHSGAEVRVEQLSLAYWRKRFTGARRAEPLMPEAPASAPQTSADRDRQAPAASGL